MEWQSTVESCRSKRQPMLERQVWNGQRKTRFSILRILQQETLRSCNPALRDYATCSAIAWGRNRMRPAEENEQENDERSQYVIENKQTGLQTKPNEANFGGGKYLAENGKYVTCGPDASGAAGRERRHGFRCASLLTSPDSPLNLTRDQGGENPRERCPGADLKAGATFSRFARCGGRADREWLVIR